MEYARVLMDNPMGQNANGDMIVLACGLEWQDVPFLPPAECEHQESMCRECIETWCLDYDIELPTIQYVIA